MMDKKWLKVRFIPTRTPLGHVRVRMKVEESIGYGMNFPIGVFNGTLDDVACAAGLARDAVTWAKIPPLFYDEVPVYWRSIASKLKAQMVELVPEAKHYAYG